MNNNVTVSHFWFRQKKAKEPMYSSYHVYRISWSSILKHHILSLNETSQQTDQVLKSDASLILEVYGS